MAKSKKSQELEDLMDALSKVRKGTYKSTTKGYKIISRISSIDKTKLLLYPRNISHNLTEGVYYID